MKVAVIGVGSMGKNHARVYSEMPGIDLVAVSDASQEVADSIAKKHGCKSYTDYKEMLDNEDVDAVSIVVPTELHFTTAMDCLEKGLHILLEKPITATVEEANRLLEIAEAKGKTFMIGHIERFNPAIIELKRRLDAGELGKVFKINARRIGPFPARIRDVGVIIDLAVHDIDIMRYLSGSDPIRVFAETERKIHTSHEDLLFGLMRFKNESLGVLSVNWLSPSKVRRLVITGEKGMFVADYLTQELKFYENDCCNGEDDYVAKGVAEGKMVQFKINRKEPLRAELEHFLDCAKEGKKPMITGHDGLMALDIALKLIKSSETNEKVDA